MCCCAILSNLFQGLEQLSHRKRDENFDFCHFIDILYPQQVVHQKIESKKVFVAQNIVMWG